MNRVREKILYYNAFPKQVTNAGSIKVEKYCNGYDAVNIGATVVTVNGIPLNPPAAGEVLGDSTSFGGNKGEIYIGRIDVQFPGGAGGNVLIIQKAYVPDFNNSLDNELNGE